MKTIYFVSSASSLSGFIFVTGKYSRIRLTSGSKPISTIIKVSYDSSSIYRVLATSHGATTEAPELGR